MIPQRPALTTFYFPIIQTSIPTSNQGLPPGSQVFGQLTLERPPNQDLALVNQVLEQHIVEANENQQRTIASVNRLVDGVQALQKLVQFQTSKLLLVEEQLRKAEQEKQEIAEEFEAYKKEANETSQALFQKVEALKRQMFFELDVVSWREARLENRLETRFSEHTHTIQMGKNTTSVPNNAVVPQDPNRII